MVSLVELILPAFVLNKRWIILTETQSSQGQNEYLRWACQAMQTVVDFGGIPCKFHFLFVGFFHRGQEAQSNPLYRSQWWKGTSGIIFWATVPTLSDNWRTTPIEITQMQLPPSCLSLYENSLCFLSPGPWAAGGFHTHCLLSCFTDRRVMVS